MPPEKLLQYLRKQNVGSKRQNSFKASHYNCSATRKITAVSQKTKWWLKEAKVLQGESLQLLSHALQIFTDTSREGLGAHLGELTARTNRIEYNRIIYIA